MKRLFYRKTQRLRSNAEFKAILAQRISAGQGPFRLFIAPNPDRLGRMGISASKTLGSPIIRNRLKRLAREAFRLNQHNLPTNLDYVLIISQKMTKKATSDTQQVDAAMSYSQFETIFMGLVKKVLQKVK
jgi:ribonuclease P protein component